MIERDNPLGGDTSSQIQLGMQLIQPRHGIQKLIESLFMPETSVFLHEFSAGATCTNAKVFILSGTGFTLVFSV